MMTRQQAKNHLKNLGWSQRGVAPRLGVCFEHLNLVLNGKRTSRRLLNKISQLQPNPKQKVTLSK